MAESDSLQDITVLIRRVEAGDHDAADALWAHCCPRLLAYCRRKLPEQLRRVLDEEDVALSAFKSFCFRAERGSFGAIEGRDALWRLLYRIASRKAAGHLRYHSREKRGSGRVQGESAFERREAITGHSADRGGIQDVESRPGGPVSMESFTRQCEAMLAELQDENLQAIALLRVEGYSVEEIAERIGCAKRTVERRLHLIREIWQSMLPVATTQSPTTGG